jgi:16S rRNA (guanine527-N7)-methyltransferase
MDIRTVLIDGCREYGVELDEIKVEKFIKYMEMLKEWNQKINLTAITDDEEIIKKHFIDSVSILQSGVIKDGMSIIDVGTGAGFPGIPLKIVMPTLNILLLDSLNKRIAYLNDVIMQLKLDGIETIHARAEELSRKKEYREKYDIAVARAVANLNKLSEYCIPYVKTGGYFISMKGPSVAPEIEGAKSAIGTLGGRLEKVIDINLPGESMEHKLVIVKKEKETGEKYPRKYAQIEKKPI